MGKDNGKNKQTAPIISSKSIIWTISIICLFALLGSYLIINSYLKQFGGDFSKTHSDWGDFGGFISGTIGTLFNLLAVVFSLLSIYITLKIAVRIHQNEQNLNKLNTKREKQKFKREIELTEKQNKPFPVVEFNSHLDKSEVVLLNEGPGTLIITKFEIYHNSKLYSNFGELVLEKISQDKNYDKLTIQFDSAKKFIITSGGSKRLFEVNNTKVSEELFEKYRGECRVFLKETNVKLEYEDIFENKFSLEESLEF